MNKQELVTLLKEISNSHEKATRDNGETFYRFTHPKAFGLLGKYPDGPLDPGQDYTYEWVGFALPSIIEHLEQNDNLEEYDVYDNSAQLVSVYTGDIIAWLASNNSNVEYVTEALKEYNPKDGFELLRLAQEHHITEVLHELVNVITQSLNEEVEE